MPGPLIFITRSRVKPGKGDEYARHVTDATELVDSQEPRVIAFSSYATETGDEVSTVQVHPDAGSLDTHLKLFEEHLAEGAFGAVDTFEIDIYGVPSDAALTALRGIPGAQVRLLAVHQGGFLRPQPL